DRLGSTIAGAALTYHSAAPVVATVSASGSITAVGNGVARVTALAQAESAVVTVRVAQRPVRVAVSSDTLRFVALGDMLSFWAVAIDSLGSPLAGGVEGLAVVDTTVVTQVDSL